MCFRHLFQSYFTFEKLYVIEFLPITYYTILLTFMVMSY